MSYAISIFGDNKVLVGDKYQDKVSDIIRFQEWEYLKKWLYEQHKIYTPSKKNNLHIVSGETTTEFRTKGSFASTSCCYFMDIDNLNGMSMNAFIEKYKHLNHHYIAYNSASCRKEDIRFRVVFELDRPVEHKEFLHFWTNLNRLYDNLFDKQTNFIEKTNACPRTFDGALNFILEKGNKKVCVNKVKNAFIYTPPQKKLDIEMFSDFKAKQIKLNGRDVYWSSIRDCPFVPMDKVQEYQSIMNTDGSGRFDLFFRIMCSVSSKAYKRKYPLTTSELNMIMSEVDANGYQRREKKMSYIKSLTNAIKLGQTVG